MSAGIPASTASPIRGVEFGSRQSVLNAKSSRITFCVSDAISRVTSSPRMLRYGAINRLKNESMVPMGASSIRVCRVSTFPLLAILGSPRLELPSLIGPECNSESSFRIFSFRSSAALFVNVKRTTSPGSRPPQELGSILSEVGEVTMPPYNFEGRLGVGSIRVALCSVVK